MLMPVFAWMGLLPCFLSDSLPSVARLIEEEVPGSKARVILYSCLLVCAKQGTKTADSEFYFVTPAYSATSLFLLMNQEVRWFCINKHDFNKDIKAIQMGLTSAYCVTQH